MAAPDNLQSRKLLISPADSDRVVSEIEAYKRAHPESRTLYEIRERVVLAQGDFSTGTKWAEITVYDEMPATLGERIPLPGVSTSGVKVASTYGVLESALSHIEHNNGYIKMGSPNATGSVVVAKLSAPPGNRAEILPSTAPALRASIPAREFLRKMEPTSDYERKLKAVASKDFVEFSEIPLLAAAAAHYTRNAPKEPAPAPGPGKWIGKLGDAVVVTGKVTRNYRTSRIDSRNQGTRHLVNIETSDGDVIQVGCTDVMVNVGDEVTIAGRITEQTMYRDRRQTLVGDGSVTLQQKQPEVASRPAAGWLLSGQMAR